MIFCTSPLLIVEKGAQFLQHSDFEIYPKTDSG